MSEFIVQKHDRHIIVMFYFDEYNSSCLSGQTIGFLYAPITPGIIGPTFPYNTREKTGNILIFFFSVKI